MSVISKMRVGTRIISAMSAICVIIVLMGAYSLYHMNTMNGYVDSIYSDSLVSIQQLTTADLNFEKMRAVTFYHLTNSNSQGNIAFSNDAQGYYDNVLAALKDYQAGGLTDTETTFLTNLRSQLAQYNSTSERMLGENSKTALQADTAASSAQANTIDGKFASLLKNEMGEARGRAASALADNHTARATFLLAIALALILTFGLGFLLSRSIANPLGELDRVAGRIAGGNLTGDVTLTDGEDEISSLTRSMHKMSENLREFIKRIQENARIVAGSSRQLNANAERTSAAASDTASAITEIAATMDDVARNTQEVAEVSERASKKAEEGMRGASRITSQMEAIAQSSHNASAVVEALTKTLDQVTGIVDLITSIADQTNLLALNAAIEAARAGEQGRGFAVVAEEVRKLAEQSAGAGKDIYQLISQVHTESGRAVDAMAEGDKDVREGTTVIADVGMRFEDIVKLVDNLSDRIQSLAAASEQISAGVQNVVGATDKQTSAMVEVSGATEALAGMADDLNQLAAHYQI